MNKVEKRTVTLVAQINWGYHLDIKEEVLAKKMNDWVKALEVARVWETWKIKKMFLNLDSITYFKEVEMTIRTEEEIEEEIKAEIKEIES